MYPKIPKLGREPKVNTLCNKSGRGREWSHLHPLPFKTVLEIFTSHGSWCGCPHCQWHSDTNRCFVLLCSEL
ncbi:hypothetical protein SPLC1_S040210 [Arthrospira platensis C1]|nr:hypothetical protein SPLC1_S040210 [Arthrospira platensis C1]